MKAKPKLNTLLKELKDPRLKDPSISPKEKDAIRVERRDKLRKKILALYDDSPENQMNEYDHIAKQLKVIKRKYDAQWEILESIDHQVQLLQK
jgi:hypothetical protein